METQTTLHGHTVCDRRPHMCLRGTWRGVVISEDTLTEAWHPGRHRPPGDCRWRMGKAPGSSPHRGGHLTRPSLPRSDTMGRPPSQAQPRATTSPSSRAPLVGMSRLKPPGHAQAGGPRLISEFKTPTPSWPDRQLGTWPGPPQPPPACNQL